MPYKDPNYMKKWRSKNKKAISQYNKKHNKETPRIRKTEYSYLKKYGMFLGERY